jgi:hypothetical protein
MSRIRTYNVSDERHRCKAIDGIFPSITVRFLVKGNCTKMHPSSSPVFSGVRVTRSLVLYVCFVDRCFSFCTFSSGYCVVCSSSIYGFWLPLWYLQTLLHSSDQTSDHHIRIYCFSANNTVLSNENKNWLARNGDNAFEWSDISTHGASFQSEHRHHLTDWEAINTNMMVTGLIWTRLEPRSTTLEEFWNCL